MHGPTAGQIHECEHCRPFSREIRDRQLTLATSVIDRGVDCRVCARPLLVIRVDGVHRCYECGIADLDLEKHVAQLWWAEDPTSGALNTGWGGGDLWACSCGSRDEDDPAQDQGEAWARSHAIETGGRVIDPAAGTRPHD